MRLTARTVNSIATPGKSVIHHAVARKPRPSAIISPQAGFGGGTPTPRKLRVPSSRIT